VRANGDHKMVSSKSAQERRVKDSNMIGKVFFKKETEEGGQVCASD